MSKLELRIKQIKTYPIAYPPTSIILNDYRIGGCKWNDIDNEKSNVIITDVEREDILIALGINEQSHELTVTKKALELVCEWVVKEYYGSYEIANGYGLNPNYFISKAKEMLKDELL